MTVMIEPPVFIAAEPLSGVPQPCSPNAPELMWTGVLVAAPTRVAFERGDRPRAVVCGHFSVPAVRSRPVTQVLLHLRIDGRALPPRDVALIEDDGDYEPEAPLEVDPAALAGAIEGGYFSFDLAPMLARVRGPATIELMVDSHGMRSNVATLRWEPPSGTARTPRR